MDFQEQIKGLVPKYKGLLEFLNDESIGLFSRYIFILHNINGDIMHVVSSHHTDSLLLFDEILKSGNLSDYFEFDPSKLPSPGKSTGFLSKKNLPFPHYTENFYTRLPLNGLTSICMGENLYLGILSFRRIWPNMITRDMNCFLYVDTDHDIVIGFNHAFYELFSDLYKSPEEILSLPVKYLLSASPGMLQNIPEDVCDPAKVLPSSKNVYSGDFRGRDLGNDEELCFNGSVTPNADGLLWCNQDQMPSIITVLKPFDTSDKDFVFSVHVKNIKGSLPFLMLGGRSNVEMRSMPDNNGYLLGRAFRQGNVLVKRCGLLALCRDDPGIPEREVDLVLCKQGNVLTLFQDGQRLISYVDQDFITGRQAYVSLGLRFGYECQLTRAALHILDTDKKASMESRKRWIVQLNHSPHLSFTMDRVYNSALNVYPFYRVAAYLLTNITEMQERVQVLDQKYQTQVQREKELLTLLKTRDDRHDVFIGSGATVSMIKDQAETIARSDARSILIQGQTGAGKEILAKYIHNSSQRKKSHFVKVDCSTIPRELIESHLFGHEKGAFTGAVSRFEGAFKQADKGTLFLDEIANLTISTQAKLLQFLNDFTITPIGSRAPVQLDIRCIVASNRDLEEEVREGVFRADLFYRINAMTIKLPPLRERREDIPELCNYFIRLFNSANNKNIAGLTPEALKKLHQYEWPGNVRQLRNVIERAVIFSSSEYLKPGDLTLPFEEQSEEGADTRAQERNQVIRVIKKYNGRVSKVIRELGVSRGSFYYYLKKNNIDINKYRKRMITLQ